MVTSQVAANQRPRKILKMHFFRVNFMPLGKRSSNKLPTASRSSKRSKDHGKWEQLSPGTQQRYRESLPSPDSWCQAAANNKERKETLALLRDISIAVPPPALTLQLEDAHATTASSTAASRSRSTNNGGQKPIEKPLPQKESAK